MSEPVMVKVGEVARFIRGITFKPTDTVIPFSQGSVVCMRTKNVQAELDQNDLLAVPKSFVKRKEQYLHEGDILVSSANSWNLVGKCSWVPSLRYEATAGGFISIFRGDKQKVYNRYLYYWLNAPSIQHDLRICGRQTTNISNLSLDRALQIEIPLPPLAEQKRIAAILDKADAIRRKRQAAIKLADDFLRATFLDMFCDPVTNPKGWKTMTLGKTVISIDGGWSVKSLDRPRIDNEWGVLKISSVTTGRLIPSENKAVPEIDKRRPIIAPQKGDLLFSRANTRELVAATCIVEKDEPNLFLPDKIWRIETNRQYVFPEYLKFLLSHRKFHEVVTAHATGTSGSMLNISKEKLRSVEIPLPGVEIQKKFANILWKIYELEAKQNQILERSLALFNSLTQRAFQGEL